MMNQFDIGERLSNLAFFLLVVIQDYKQLGSDSRVGVGDLVKDRPFAFVLWEVDHFARFLCTCSIFFWMVSWCLPAR